MPRSRAESSMPRQDIVRAELLVMEKKQFVALRQHQLAGGGGPVPADGETGLSDGVGIEQAKFAEESSGRAARSRMREMLVGLRERLGHHVVAECRDVGYAATPAFVEIGTHARMMEMLVNVGEEHPVSDAAALLPDVVA